MTTNVMKQAVCVLIQFQGGWSCPLYLSVSRRNDTTQWGLPGGKVDPGEDKITAAVRELQEETNIVIPQTDLIPIYTGIAKGGADGVDYEVTTYKYIGPRGPISWINIKAEEEHEIGLCTREELCEENTSPFAVYNRHLFEMFEPKLSSVPCTA